MNKNENLVLVLKEPQFKKTHPETDPKEWEKNLTLMGEIQHKNCRKPFPKSTSKGHTPREICKTRQEKASAFLSHTSTGFSTPIHIYIK